MLSLAKRGVRSIFSYRSNRAEAERVATLAREAAVQAIALQLDAGDVSAFDDFVDRVREALHRLGAERFDYLRVRPPPTSAVAWSATILR